MCRRVARTQARMAGRVGNKATQSQASMAMTVLQDISTVREGMSPLTISILRPKPSNLCESGLKRFHRRTVHNALRQTVVDVDVSEDRPEGL